MSLILICEGAVCRAGSRERNPGRIVSFDRMRKVICFVNWYYSVKEKYSSIISALKSHNETKLLPCPGSLIYAQALTLSPTHVANPAQLLTATLPWMPRAFFFIPTKAS